MVSRRSGPTPTERPGLAPTRHVVVDGSNIATEGRELPSLVQLDEAVQAYIAEFGPQIVTVVVDASFPNRIARSERKVYEDAVVAGEIITPPAGAIGRGDAFILQIADRAQATILSNDSFQEFHGQYDWLFDKGRLVGGKPVPHVGWVFIDRAPVRGPTSRRAVSLAKQALNPPPAKAAANAAKPPKATKASRAEKAAAAPKPPKAEKAPKALKAPKAAKATNEPKAAREPKATKAEKAQKAAKATKAAAPTPPAAIVPVVETPPGYNEALPFIEFVGAHPVGSSVDGVVEQFSSHGAYVRVDGVLAYAPLKHLADPAPRSAKQVLRVGESRSFVVVAVEPARRGVDLALPGVPLDGGPVAAAPPPAAVSAPVAPVEPPKAKATRARKSAKAAKATKAEKASTAAATEAPVTGAPATEAPAPTAKAAAKKAAAVKKAPAKKAAKATKAATRKAAARKAAAEPAASAAAAAPSAAKKATRSRKVAKTARSSRTPAGEPRGDQ